MNRLDTNKPIWARLAKACELRGLTSASNGCLPLLAILGVCSVAWADDSELYPLAAKAAFTRGKIVVSNANDFNWRDCSFTINPDNLEWSFWILHIELAAHNTVSLEPTAFKSAGTVYSPKRWPPATMRLVCTAPDEGRSAAQVPVS
jgi:hypothetical protein